MELDDLINILFSGKKRYILSVCNLVLWGSVLFVSFSVFVEEHELIPMSQPDQILHFIASGEYIKYIQWLIILITIYYVAKFFLVNYFISPKFVKRIFPVIVPEVTSAAFIALTTSVKNVKKIHLKRAKMYLSDYDEKQNKLFLNLCELLIGILLKVVILGFLTLNMGREFNVVSWISSFLAIAAILILEYSVIKSKGKSELSMIIKSLGN